MKKEITLNGVPVYHTFPDDGQKHPGLIVIEEIWGVTDHIKDVAGRFAAQGYSVLSPELLHGMPFLGKVDQSVLADMQDPEKRDEAQKKLRTAMAPVQAPEFAEGAIAVLKACVDYLMADENVDGNVGVVGFCFGGSYSFKLASTDSRIKATVPFYGHAPSAEEVETITGPVLAFYGTEDAALMESLPKLKEDMEKEGKEFEAVVFENTGHAFFNDTNALMYRPGPAAEAWDKTLAFLAHNL
ncbi:MAG: dienelactone hydrolase family protein [Parcubacteria group bacterium]|nr:dienelactone hydrolase family protein [Parcubacteria group bacterium]